MRQIKPQRIKEKTSRVTLLGVIANGSTANARKLLKQYDYPDAVDYDDLEFKLTQIYRKEDDKSDLEKQLATIHPHKDFILKYLAPENKEANDKNLEVENISPEIPTKPCSCGNPYCPSIYNGKCSVLETKSNASGCGCSGVDGSEVKTEKASSTDKGMLIGASMLGLFTIGIIAIFALTVNKQ